MENLQNLTELEMKDTNGGSQFTETLAYWAGYALGTLHSWGTSAGQAASSPSHNATWADK